ncbi:PucR family transcriptional regulator [Leucobacter sp. GX0328]
MHATVSDILAIPAVRATSPVLLGGSKYLDGAVRWMHTTDGTDLAGLLKGGEMILTAGEAITGSPEAAAEYFAGLVRNGASGVMVSLLHGDEHAKLVLRAASGSAGLPVILLRDRVPFVDLTEAVHRVLLSIDRGDGPETDLVRLIDRLSVESASPTEILRRTSELLLAPVVYEDLHHGVVAYATAGLQTERLLENWANRSRSVSSAAGITTGDWLQVNYREREETVGRLVVPMRLPGPQPQAILERAAQVLELCYANLGRSYDVRFRAPVGAFEELRVSGFMSEASARLRAEASGIAAAAEYVPLAVVRAAAPAHAADAAAGSGPVLDALYRAAAERGVPLLACELSADAIGVVVGVPAGKEARDVLQSLARAADLGADGALSAGEWSVGIGPSAAELQASIDAGVDEARAVAEAAIGVEPRLVPYATVGDVRLRRLLRSMSDEARIRSFVDESLAELKAEGNDTLRILRAYIELNGNIAEVARAVYLSRPSVYARLNRIEAVIGSSLGSADTRTGLYVALLADANGETGASGSS